MKLETTPTIVLATHNVHKAKEFREMLDGKFEVLTMSDIGIMEEPIEDGETIQENADIKVSFLNERLPEDNTYILLADDTGLFVDALDGAPGVYTARYAGENCTFDDNNQKLLRDLEGVTIDNRGATFATSLSIMLPNKERHNVTGNVKGSIATKITGDEGFGYDPVFIEESTKKAYAQMNSKEKNTYSHRRRALDEAKAILEEWIV